MTPDATLDVLRRHLVTPVVRESSVERARAVVAALRQGGFRVFEVTMSVPDALTLVETLASDADLTVGLGTVLRAEDAEAAVRAGARFVVSPAVVPEVAEAARSGGAAAILGALTPTEVLAARHAGAHAVKVFPAESVGGAAHVKALRSVFPDVPFIPTGGVGLHDLRAYVDAGVHSVGVGGALAPADVSSIPALARRYLAEAAHRSNAPTGEATS